MIDHYRSHADFESNCSLCHQPLEKEQADLCVACHKDVADQLENKTGAHGRLDSPRNCAGCHADHQGRSFDPLQAALQNFDHSRTAFPLSGKHSQVECKDCHPANRYDQAKTNCVSCHQEPAQHAGVLGVDCAACHSTEGWKPATMDGKAYDHAQYGFSLVKHTAGYNAQAITCVTCHRAISTAFNQRICTACHNDHDAVFMAKHTAQYGADCLQCHDGVDRMHAFQHAAFFPLEGKHVALECASCHAGLKFKGTPLDCSGCHKEPAIHAGSFGLKCQYCHIVQGWQPALLRVHGFPLDHGGKGVVECKTCHTGTYAVYTCYTCHDHQPDEIQQSHNRAGISVVELPDCVACHLDGAVHKN